MSRCRKRRVASIILLTLGLFLGLLWIGSAWYKLTLLFDHLVLEYGNGVAGLLWAPFLNKDYYLNLERHGADWEWLAFDSKIDHITHMAYLEVPAWLPATAMILLGVWGIRATRPFPAGNCQACGYDLRGSKSDRCSECGATIGAARRTRRFRRRRIASMILLASGLLLGLLWIGSAWFLFQIWLGHWGAKASHGAGLIVENNLRTEYSVRMTQHDQVWTWFEWRFNLTNVSTYVVCPLWLPAAILILLGVWGIRATRRFPAGSCPSCSYDLRGSESKRCSECGAATEAA